MTVLTEVQLKYSYVSLWFSGYQTVFSGVHEWCLPCPREKEMATPSSILACRIPWTEEPGGPQSIESQSAEHDWSGLAFTEHRQGVGCVRSQEQPRGVWAVRFYGLDKFTGWWVGGIVQLPWRRDWDLQELGLCLLFWPQELSSAGGRAVETYCITGSMYWGWRSTGVESSTLLGPVRSVL